MEREAKEGFSNNSGALALHIDLIMREGKGKKEEGDPRAKWISVAMAKAATLDAELIPAGNQLEGAFCRIAGF